MQNVLGHVPLIPCYLNGKTSNTIPYRCRGAIPAEAAAIQLEDLIVGQVAGSSRSTYGHGRTFPRDVAVADAVAMRKQRVEESRARGAATRQRRIQAQARAAGVAPANNVI